MKILITGGAGFIGSCVVRQALLDPNIQVVNVDKLTYAGNLASLPETDNNPNYHFSQIDICDAGALDDTFTTHEPDVVMHLAAESHVDRSIDGPEAFMQTNIMGTYQLLKQADAISPTRLWIGRRLFVSTIFPLTKCMATLRVPKTFSVKILPMPRRLLTPPAKPVPIIWFGPGIEPTVCRCWSPTAQQLRPLSFSGKTDPT